MPFTSKAQMKKCFAMKGRNQAKGWDCESWAHKTKSIKKLPEHVDKKAAVVELEKQASTLAELLGIRAAAALLERS